MSDTTPPAGSNNPPPPSPPPPSPSPPTPAPPGPHPPRYPNASEHAAKAAAAAGKVGAVGAKTFKQFVFRVARSDFYLERATDPERASLAKARPPIASESAQDYAAWRRAVLGLAAILLVVTAILGVIDYALLLDSEPMAEAKKQTPQIETFFESIETRMYLIQLGPTLFTLLAAALAVAAAAAWRTIGVTRLLARLSWVAIFVLPMLWLLIPWLAGLPWDNVQDEMEKAIRANAGLQIENVQQQAEARFGEATDAAAIQAWEMEKAAWDQREAYYAEQARMNWQYYEPRPFPKPRPTARAAAAQPAAAPTSDIDRQAEEQAELAVKTMQDGLSVAIAMGVLVAFGPRVIGLFPGLIRSCLTLKTLLPESSAPGWVALIIAPFYAVFFAVVLIASIQADYSWMLSMSALFFTISPLFVILRWRRVASPMTQQQAHSAIRSTRRLSGVFAALGVIFFGILMITQIAVEAIDTMTAVTSLLAVLANILLVTVVMSDLMLGMLHRAFEETTAFQTGDMHAALAGRYAELRKSGISKPQDGERHTAAAVGSAAAAAGRAGRQWFADQVESGRPAAHTPPPPADRPDRTPPPPTA